jgi:procollagen-lysine,2-oxoglutarate 5-dioxygenase
MICSRNLFLPAESHAQFVYF